MGICRITTQRVDFTLIDMKEITILLAVRNGEQWIEKAILSIKNQTLKEYEFLIVDDGSTDLTKKIILRYGEVDSRIRYIYKDHSGLTKSLNYGLGKASGKWIARLDADDLALPERLSNQLNFVKDNKDTVLLGSNFLLKKNKSIIYSSNLPNSNSKLVYRLRTMKGFFPHSSAFFLKDIAIKVGGYRSSFIKSQDHDLWLRLSERGEIHCLNEKLTIINEHNKRISNLRSDYSQQVYTCAAIVCHFFRIKNGTDKEIYNENSGFRILLELLESYLVKKDFFKLFEFKEEIKSFFPKKKRETSIIKSIYKVLTHWKLLYELLKFYYFGSKLPFRFYEFLSSKKKYDTFLS